MSSESSRDSRYGWVIVAVSMLALMISNGLATLGIPVFYKAIQTEFLASGAVPADQAQTFIANGANLTFLLSGVFSFVGGWVIPRFGLKRLMIFGCICLGTGLVLHSQATTVAAVYLSRFLMGVSLGFVGVTPNVVLISKWFRESRGTALGVALTGTSIGGVIIPLISTPLILAYGWRNAMFAVSLSVWLILLPAIILLVRENETPDDSPQAEHGGFTFAESLRTPTFWIFALCAALVFYPIFVTTQQFILYLQSPRIGMPLETASWVQSVLFAVSVGGKSAVGFLSDRFTSTRMVLACAFVMFASTFVLLALNADNVLLFIVPFGFGYGGTFVLLQRMASDYFGMKDYGRILGTIVMIEIAGAFVGGTITSRLADAAGGDYAQPFRIVIGVTAGVLVCTILLNLMDKAGHRGT
ncbi:MAG: MFS transporter [Acidobacteriota bacterium]